MIVIPLQVGIIESHIQEEMTEELRVIVISQESEEMIVIPLQVEIIESRIEEMMNGLVHSREAVVISMKNVEMVKEKF